MFLSVFKACASVLQRILYPGSPTTALHTLSLHDALPISIAFIPPAGADSSRPGTRFIGGLARNPANMFRSEEHTSELQSPCNLVFRLLLEKKKIFMGTGGNLHLSRVMHEQDICR